MRSCQRIFQRKRISLLASEVADAGCVLLSRSQEATVEEISSTKEHLNRALGQIQCRRCLDSEILTGNWNDLTDADLEKILDCGYVAEDYVKESYAEGGGFDSLFFMNVHKSEEELHETAERILNDPSCGDVFRVKGFLRKEDGQWLELNATRHEICIRPAKLGQEIMIVIGEKLNKEVIDGYWKYTAGKQHRRDIVSEKAFEELPDTFQKLAELLGEISLNWWQ